MCLAVELLIGLCFVECDLVKFLLLRSIIIDRKKTIIIQAVSKAVTFPPELSFIMSDCV